MVDRLDPLAWLMAWYADQCDGEWEHSFGVKISTLDNPGWSVSFELEGTPWAETTFDRVEIDKGDDDWIHLWVDRTGSSVFTFASSPNRLADGISRFAKWTEAHPPTSPRVAPPS